jgi:putative SOS response-associated peptidase YedK
MCFRIEQEGENVGALVRAIEALFEDMVVMEEMHTSPNIALTDQAMVVVQRKELQLRGMRFGLVPSWHKKVAVDPNLGNARGEMVDQLPSFKEPFQKRRYLMAGPG